VNLSVCFISFLLVGFFFFDVFFAINDLVYFVVSNPDCIESSQRLTRCGRKLPWPNFKALSWNLPVGSEENHENLQSG
jgi:hypothetical protein